MGGRGLIVQCEGWIFINSLMFHIIPNYTLTANCRDNIVYIQIVGNENQFVSRKCDVTASVKNSLSSRQF